MREAGVDSFNRGYVTTPGTFEEVVNLLVPELRRRGLCSARPLVEWLTAREKISGKGHKGLRDDHTGSGYRYDVYQEEAADFAPEERIKEEETVT